MGKGLDSQEITPPKSMEEFQRVYLPSQVGRICPCCGKPFDDTKDEYTLPFPKPTKQTEVDDQ